MRCGTLLQPPMATNTEASLNTFHSHRISGRPITPQRVPTARLPEDEDIYGASPEPRRQTHRNAATDSPTRSSTRPRRPQDYSIPRYIEFLNYSDEEEYGLQSKSESDTEGETSNEDEGGPMVMMMMMIAIEE